MEMTEMIECQTGFTESTGCELNNPVHPVNPVQLSESSVSALYTVLGSDTAVRTLIALLLLSGISLGREVFVSDAGELKNAAKQLAPGDTVILKEGEWRDSKIELRGRGMLDSPITLRAAVPGKTILTGSSSLRLAGEFLVIDGLVFSDPDPELSDLIQFRIDSDELAQHCRMTNCAVTSQQIGNSSQESRWVGLYGSDHRIDHCTFEGKSGKGTTFVVWLGAGSDGRHRIDHNYFGRREQLRKNGGETIRIGDSKTADLTASCVVEQNLFERCNGETECISNKSCGNIYRDNTFREVSGSLTLRHGNDCVVERNVFLGNKARGTGGIRVIGENHVVRGNYLENLTGDDARAAICLMMGIPNSPANRYRQVAGAVIEGNSIVNCEHSILIGLSDDKNAVLAPKGTTFRSNRVSSPKYALIEARCKLDGITWIDNHFSGRALGIVETSGIEQGDAHPRPLSPIPRSEVGPAWQIAH
jgi:poly(beta-D-mannuronate) lyase